MRGDSLDLKENKPTNKTQCTSPRNERTPLTGLHLSLQMGSLTVWILIAVYRVPAKTNPTAADCLILRTSSAKAYSPPRSKLPNLSMIESVFLQGLIAPMSYPEKVLSIRGQCIFFLHRFVVVLSIVPCTLYEMLMTVNFRKVLFLHNAVFPPSANSSPNFTFQAFLTQFTRFVKFST